MLLLIYTLSIRMRPLILMSPPTSNLEEWKCHAAMQHLNVRPSLAHHGDGIGRGILLGVAFNGLSHLQFHKHDVWQSRVWAFVFSKAAKPVLHVVALLAPGYILSM